MSNHSLYNSLYESSHSKVCNFSESRNLLLEKVNSKYTDLIDLNIKLEGEINKVKVKLTEINNIYQQIEEMSFVQQQVGRNFENVLSNINNMFDELENKIKKIKLFEDTLNVKIEENSKTFNKNIITITILLTGVYFLYHRK